ncbi:MAG TPA: GLPGLI family protein [Patescibacteria group bacterium]|jgi:GLPGLI family protein|nr:GLPGLI family protein [Patescibacteria group bacterium]
MKHFLFLFLLTAMSFVSYGQLKDSVLFKASYIYANQGEDKNPGFLPKDSLVVEIGKRFSICYSEWERLAELYVEDEFKKQLQTQKGQLKLDMTTFSLPKFGMTQRLYKLFNQNKIVVTDRILKDKFIYEDSLDLFKWQILSDTATISGYKCQRATTFFRGRHYDAWFSDQIPIQNGPLKFGNLPGLIVQVNDSDRLFYFRLTSFEKVSQIAEIELNQNGFIKTERKKFMELRKAMFQNPQAFLGGQGATFQYKSDVPLASKKYIPMELE